MQSPMIYFNLLYNLVEPNEKPLFFVVLFGVLNVLLSIVVKNPYRKFLTNIFCLLQIPQERSQRLSFELPRKSFHLLGCSAVVFFNVFSDVQLRKWSIFFITMSFILLAVDYARVKIPSVNKFALKYFSNLIRESEQNHITGVFPFWFGLGDCAAAFFGIAIGGPKIFGKKKTIAGTVANMVVCFLLSGMYYRFSIIIGICCGLFEAVCGELVNLDDNLLIPVGCGLVASFVRKYMDGFKFV